jgi:hypothetical protein
MRESGETQSDASAVGGLKAQKSRALIGLIRWNRTTSILLDCRGHVVLAAADDCEPLTRRRSCIQETYPHRAMVRDPTSEFSTRASPR